MPDVRTTLQPGNVINVGESEFLDLDRQGLILEVVTGPVVPPSEVMKTVPVKVVSTADPSTSNTRTK
jgi:hypothetical protein